MRKIRFYLGTGFAGCFYEEDFEFDDDVTEEEISDEYEQWVEGLLDITWWEILDGEE